MSASESIATHVVLVRHGQSLFNRDGAAAFEDSGLTELGWHQAHLVADWLERNVSADGLVSSSLVRARQTAEVIAQRLGLPAQVLPGFKEADKPYWQEFPPGASDPLASWTAPWQPTVENAPLYTQFRSRLHGALAELMGLYTGKTVIVVSHGGVIGTTLRSLFGGHMMPIFTENCGVTHVTWQDGRWRLNSHNERGHLAETYTERFTWPTTGAAGSMIEYFARVSAADVPGSEPGADPALRSLVALASPHATDRLLDIGVGTGHVALAFAPRVAHVTAVDISPAMLERAESARLAQGISNMAVRWADALALPYPEGGFDLAISHDLMQHIADLAGLGRSIRRVLKPGGKWVMDELIGSEDTVKRATQEAIEIQRSAAFAKLHSLSEIESQMRATGFHIESVEHYDAPQTLEGWLAAAALDEKSAARVREMLLSSAEGDASGLRTRTGRNGDIAFTQRRVRLAARSTAD